MDAQLTADDLWPLVQKLASDQQVRLVKLALMAAASSPESDRDAYRTSPPMPAELASDDEGLAWEAEGWEKVDASR
jgi:hypothetical protein